MSQSQTETPAVAEAPVPLVDLGIQHRQIAGEVNAAISGVLDATAFVLGPEVVAFEQEYAAS